MEKCWGQNVDTPHLFIDFQAAYDTVWRKELWSEMHELCFPKKLVTWTRILNNEMHAKVKIGIHLSSEFKVNKGLPLCC